jgi:hypothetical protein
VVKKAYFNSTFTSGFASSFFRIRLNSMKHSAVIVHSTEANMIITFVSIGEVSVLPITLPRTYAQQNA